MVVFKAQTTKTVSIQKLVDLPANTMCFLPAQYYSHNLLQRFDYHPNEGSRQGPQAGRSVEVVSTWGQDRTTGKRSSGFGVNLITRCPSSQRSSQAYRCAYGISPIALRVNSSSAYPEVPDKMRRKQTEVTAPEKTPAK